MTDNSIKNLQEEIAKLKNELADVKSKNSVADSNQRFINLFDEMSSASALHKLIYNDKGEAIDYSFIRINKMFEEFTGLKASEIIGKNVTEVIPNIEKYWIEKYANVVSTGEPIEFENYSKPLNKHYRVKAYKSEEDHFVVTFVDITDRIKSEKKIEETKLFYEKILESTHDGIWVTDENDNIIYANQSLLKITHANLNQLIGQNVINDVSNHANNNFLEDYLKAKNELKQIEYIANFQLNTGEVSVQSGWLSPIIKDGIYSGMICTIQDITERHQIQEELAKSEEKLRNIIEHSTNMFYTHTIDNQLTFVSPQVKEIIGYTPEEALIKWTEFASDNPLNADAFEKTMKAIKTGKVQKPYELELVHKSGRKVWVIVNEAPLVKNGKTVAIVGALKDITEQKEIERNLREHEVRFQDIVQNLNGVVYRCKNDAKWTMLFLSNGIKNMSGYKSKELINNKTISFFDLIIPEHRKVVDEIVQKAINKNESYQIEYQIKTKSGEKKWVFEQGSGVKNDKGELSYLEGYIFDISERKNMELEIMEKNKEIAAQNEEFLSINEELQSTIEQIKTINEQLKEAKLKAEESDRLKSAFLANMSHEIRTPMNSIIGFSSLLTDEKLEKKKRDRFSDLILSSGEHLLRIIDDIVDIAKIESNQLKITKSPQNLEILLNEVYSSNIQHEIILRNKELKLKLDISNIGHELSINTDPIRFKQILNNLLSNAIKNTDKGEIKFGVKSINYEDNQICFYVKDTGKGISNDYQKKIFERFIQVRTENPSAGTGLGLSITQGILQLMGGKIWLDSKLGEGSTFYFSIPFENIEEEEMEISELKRSFTIPNLKDKLIYIAEDEHSSFILLKEILEITNAKVKHAENGKQLIELVQRETPELILADINMPVLNGVEAVKKIREFNKETPIIAQTAYALLEEKEDCLKAGCNAYISKPIDANLLFELINQNLTTK